MKKVIVRPDYKKIMKKVIEEKDRILKENIRSIEDSKINDQKKLFQEVNTKDSDAMIKNKNAEIEEQKNHYKKIIQEKDDIIKKKDAEIEKKIKENDNIEEKKNNYQKLS